MEPPANPAATVSPPSSLPQDHIRSEHVWQNLSPAQQQLVFRTIVRVCRSLVTPPTPQAGDREVGHEPT
jgi:hypothetical protein